MTGQLGVPAGGTELEREQGMRGSPCSGARGAGGGEEDEELLNHQTALLLLHAFYSIKMDLQENVNARTTANPN